MVCKSDIVSCFKELESHERIRVMCNLLHLCHPSELRYFGTCLEYLGKRDFHELRQLENVANSPAEINSLDLQCLNDKTVRKKLVLYLSLLHSNNDVCSSRLFKILSNWSEVDKCFKAHPMSEDEETPEDFLMLYTLAANHPAFTLEQKLSLENIYSKLLAEKQRFTEVPRLESPPAYPVPSYPQLPKLSSQMMYEPQADSYPWIASTSQCPYPAPPLTRPTQNESPDAPPPNSYLRLLYQAPPTPLMPPPWGPHSLVMPPPAPVPAPAPVPTPAPTAAPVPMEPHVSPGSPASSPCQSNTPSRPSSPGRTNPPSSVPAPAPAPVPVPVPVPIPAPAPPLPPPHYVPLPAPPVPAPPPLDPLRESILKEMPNYMSNLQGFNIHQLRVMCDEELSELGLPQNAMHQLRSIVSRLQTTNGMNNMVDMSFLSKQPPDVAVGVGAGAGAGVTKVDNGASCHSCLTMGGQQPVECCTSPVFCTAEQMRALYIDNEPNLVSSSESENNSPPDTPETSVAGPMVAKETQVLSGECWSGSSMEDNSRKGAIDVNNGGGVAGVGGGGGIGVGGAPGGEERKPINTPVPPISSISTRARGVSRGTPRSQPQQSLPRARTINPNHRKRSDNLLPVNGGLVPDESQQKMFPSESQFPFTAPSPSGYMHVFRSYPTFPPDQMLRHAYTFQPNSEMLYQHYPPPAFIQGPITFPAMVTPPKVSCYNCGSQSHNGHECPEPTIEDVAKQGQYRIDYSRFGECPPASDK